MSGCIWTARRDRGMLLFGGHLVLGHVMDLVVVWWSFAVTWRLGSSDGSVRCLVDRLGSSEAECHLKLVWCHLIALAVDWWSFAVIGGS